MSKGLAAAAGMLAAAAIATSSAAAEQSGPQGERGDAGFGGEGQEVHVLKGRVTSVNDETDTVTVALKPRCGGRKGRRPQQDGEGSLQQGPQGEGPTGEGPQGQSGPGGAMGDQQNGRPHGPRAGSSRRKKCGRRGRKPQGQSPQGESPQGGQQGESPQGGPQISRSRRGSRSATVKTDSDTRIRRNGQSATLADLQQGDKVTVVITTDEPTSLDQALQEAADVIRARTKPASPSPQGQQ